MYCFDTDVLSALIRPRPLMHLVRRLARTPADQQFTTAITVGELIFGVARRGDPALTVRVQSMISTAGEVLPFDSSAAEVYGSIRAQLEAEGRPLAEPDLRIAAIVLSRGLTLVTGNERHFARVPGLPVQNWLAE